MNQQIVTPVSYQPDHTSTESMTFSDELARDSFIIRERSRGWEVFLSYQGTNRAGVELYHITRQRVGGAA